MCTEAASAPSALGVLAVRAAAVATMASSVSERSPPAVVAATIGRSGSSGSSRTRATGQPPSRPLTPDVIAESTSDSGLRCEMERWMSSRTSSRRWRSRSICVDAHGGNATQRQPENARHAHQQICARRR